MLRTCSTLVLAAGLGLAAVGCVGALGLDEENRSAIETLCQCPEMASVYGYGSKAECVADLEPRLERVTEPTRAAWMQNFSRNFSVCTPESVAKCFLEPPTCEGVGECPAGNCSRCCVQGAGQCGQL